MLSTYNLGTRPSFLWRSFLAGREVLDLGVRFQVGTGHSIHVWEDRWVPLPYAFKPHSLNRHKWPDLFVHELMLPGGKDWNQQLLSYLFHAYKVQAVLKIPLCPEMITDRIVWHHKKNGVYAVKSGYSVLQQQKQSLEGGTSSTGFERTSTWNGLWNWSTLPKIKHFIWQAMHNVLPLGVNLLNRMSVSVKCPHCSCVYETDKHVFRDCTYARKIWNLLGLNHIWSKLPATSFYSFISCLIADEDEHTVTLTMITLWLLWKARCSKQFEAVHMPPNQLMSTACVLLHESMSLKESKGELHNYLDAWYRPPSGTHTINVDASVLEDGRASFGVLIRNEEGNIVASRAGPLLQNISVENAELLAVLKGLQLAKEIKLEKAILISDSLLAYNRLNSNDLDWSLLSPLVQQVRFLSHEFGAVSFDFFRSLPTF